MHAQYAQKKVNPANKNLICYGLLHPVFKCNQVFDQVSSKKLIYKKKSDWFQNLEHSRKNHSKWKQTIRHCRYLVHWVLGSLLVRDNTGIIYSHVLNIYMYYLCWYNLKFMVAGRGTCVRWSWSDIWVHAGKQVTVCATIL
jgi:hypothetical protein